MKTERFIVKFYHNNGKNIDYPRGTTCKINLIESNEEIISSTAKLYFKDTFCKQKGRKISLLKALSDYPFLRNERTEIWVGYFRAFKK